MRKWRQQKGSSGADEEEEEEEREGGGGLHGWAGCLTGVYISICMCVVCECVSACHIIKRRMYADLSLL